MRLKYVCSASINSFTCFSLENYNNDRILAFTFLNTLKRIKLLELLSRPGEKSCLFHQIRTLKMNYSENRKFLKVVKHSQSDSVGCALCSQRICGFDEKSKQSSMALLFKIRLLL